LYQQQKTTIIKMKKLFVIISLAAGTLLMSCSASVHTRKHRAGVSVGSIEKVEPPKSTSAVGG
jgi:hypothetical protein